MKAELIVTRVDSETDPSLDHSQLVLGGDAAATARDMLDTMFRQSGFGGAGEPWN